MEYTGAVIGKTQLDEFVSIVPGIYSAKDDKRSTWDVWYHTIHHAAAIGEEVRKGAAGSQLLIEIADFSLWLFTIIHKLNGTIGQKKSKRETVQERIIRIKNTCSDLLWNKYPRMCPVCYWRRTKGDRGPEGVEGFLSPCDCLLYDVEGRNQSQKRLHVTTMRAFCDDNRSRKPKGVDEWQEMFSTIFKANLPHLTLVDIAFHLLEEIGEVSDAIIRMYTYKKEDFIKKDEPLWRQIWLEEEFADVFSWLFTLVEKLNLMRETADEYDRWRFGATFVARKPMHLSEIIWKRYGSDDLRRFYCPHCTEPECQCPIVLVPPDRSIAELLQNVSEDIPKKGD